MGTIRKISGEFYYRKDGVSHKFFNQGVLITRYPDYSEPFQIEDYRVYIKSDMAFLVDELPKTAPVLSDTDVSNAIKLLKKALEGASPAIVMPRKKYKEDLRKAFDAGEFGELSFEDWYKHFIG
jgi:hypothetical protein